MTMTSPSLFIFDSFLTVSVDAGFVVEFLTSKGKCTVIWFATRC